MSNKLKMLIGALLTVGVSFIILFFIIGNNEKKYTVSFDSDGGSVVEKKVIVKGEKVSKPVNPTKDGYTFVRWNYENEEYDFNLAVNKDLLLKAIWEKDAIKYTITFKIDNKEEKIEVSNPSEIDLETLNIEEKDGYELVWYVNGNKYDLNSPLTENLILEGKYEKIVGYTVKFNSDGGSRVNNQTVKSGERAQEPSNVTKYGFILDGWYLNSKKYDFTTSVTKNITLKAKWNEDPNVLRYTVSFDSDGGSKVSNQRIIEKQTASIPNVPIKSGYAFVEWQVNGKKYDFKNSVTSNLVLKAIWRELEKYTVTFKNDDDKIIQSNIVVEGNTVSKPSDSQKDGYTFKEWQLDGQAFDFNTKITKNIVLKAYYIKNPNKYTVTFTDGVESQSVVEGEKVNRPTNPKKDGYTFIEWQLDGQTFDFNTPIKSNINLTAYWKDNTEYTIKATRADNYSPDSILKVYKNNTEISFKEIRYNDGVYLCSGSKPVVATSDIENEKTLTVKLMDGNEVKATIK